MSKDLVLDLTPGVEDIKIENYDMSLTDGDTSEVQQALHIRLQFFFSEWFLDNTTGIKYYEFVFVKNPDPNVVSAVMKTFILETPGVNELLSYEQKIDNSLRRLTVTFTVDTVAGQLTTSETIGV